MISDFRIVSAGDFLILLAHPAAQRLSRMQLLIGHRLVLTLEPPEEMIHRQLTAQQDGTKSQ
jgi:hypothetical protein